MISMNAGACTIGGVAVEEIVALTGTPVYVYDPAVM